ncbi:type II secretion system protein [Candidatus Margulisiibacteriota bacterium]
MKSKGFTLLELLVVITIISIIAVFMMPNFLGIKDRTKEAGVKAVMRSVQLAIESYEIENTFYPLDNNITLRQLCDDYLLDPGYVSKIPKNPFTGKEYAADDTAGKILYFYDEPKGSYRMVGYKRNGTTELLELTNI